MSKYNQNLRNSKIKTESIRMTKLANRIKRHWVEREYGNCGKILLCVMSYRHSLVYLMATSSELCLRINILLVVGVRNPQKHFFLPYTLLLSLFISRITPFYVRNLVVRYTYVGSRPWQVNVMNFPFRASYYVPFIWRKYMENGSDIEKLLN